MARPAGFLSERSDRAGFSPTTLDLMLATVIGLGLPFAAAWLFDWTGGAWASLLNAAQLVWIARSSMLPDRSLVDRAR